MDRRSFIRQAGIAGVGAASLATVAAISLPQGCQLVV
jgi:TRAP-type mannitol/chloroaromatic compound transport system substrate-binding protein